MCWTNLLTANSKNSATIAVDPFRVITFRVACCVSCAILGELDTGYSQSKRSVRCRTWNESNCHRYQNHTPREYNIKWKARSIKPVHSDRWTPESRFFWATTCTSAAGLGCANNRSSMYCSALGGGRDAECRLTRCAGLHAPHGQHPSSRERSGTTNRLCSGTRLHASIHRPSFGRLSHLWRRRPHCPAWRRCRWARRVRL